MDRPATFVLFSLLSVAFVPQTATAQGSTGGTLGKTDQSLSGGGQIETPDKGKSVKSAPSSDKRAADGLPQTINIIDRSSFGEYRAQLTRTGASTFEGTWNHGITFRMTVTAFTRDQVVMQRTDIAGGVLVSGQYSGKRVGNRVTSGTARFSTGFVSSWEASW